MKINMYSKWCLRIYSVYQLDYRLASGVNWYRCSENTFSAAIFFLRSSALISGLLVGSLLAGFGETGRCWTAGGGASYTTAIRC